MHTAAPLFEGSSGQSPDERVELLEELVAALHPHTDRRVWRTLTTPQKELLADVVDARSRDGGSVVRWWRSEGAGAAPALRISLPEVASSHLQGAAAAGGANVGSYKKVVLGGSVCRIMTAEFASALVSMLAGAKVETIEIHHAAPSVADAIIQAGARHGISVASVGANAA